MKYLCINLICTTSIWGKCKILMKDIKEIKRCSMFMDRKMRFVKMAVFLTQSRNAVPSIKIPTRFWGYWQTNFKVYIERQKTNTWQYIQSSQTGFCHLVIGERIVNSILKEKNNVRGLPLHDCKTYSKAQVIKIVWHWWKSRQIYQWKRIKSPETDHLIIINWSLTK